MPFPQHVLIVGGGLCGPALALSLARRGIKSTIFEIRKESSDSGGSITLAPNALRVLDRYVGVYDRIKATGFVYSELAVYDDDNYRFGTILQKQADYPSIRLMRSEFHRILLEACEERKHLIDVRWGARLTRIDDGAESVVAHFEDGSHASGDLLFGTDGIHSRVREHVMGADAPQPVFSGTCTVAGFAPTASIDMPAEHQLPFVCFNPRGMIMVIPTDASGSTCAFGISTSIDEKGGRASWTDFERSGEAARMAKAAYDGYDRQPIRSLVDGIDEETYRLWAPYSLPGLPKWHKGRVLLLGGARLTL